MFSLKSLQWKDKTVDMTPFKCPDQYYAITFKVRWNGAYCFLLLSLLCVGILQILLWPAQFLQPPCVTVSVAQWRSRFVPRMLCVCVRDNADVVSKDLWESVSPVRNQLRVLIPTSLNKLFQVISSNMNVFIRVCVCVLSTSVTVRLTVWWL